VSDYVDQEKMCRDCPEKFVFTAGEQAFFAEKQFNPPTRCPSCRAKRKAAAAGQGFNPSPGMSPRPRCLHGRESSTRAAAAVMRWTKTGIGEIFLLVS
jgi:hypothetical protein